MSLLQAVLFNPNANFHRCLTDIVDSGVEQDVLFDIRRTADLEIVHRRRYNACLGFELADVSQSGLFGKFV